MPEKQIHASRSNPVVFGVEIWNAKGVQIVLNKLSNSEMLDFESRIEFFRGILKYPGMWDELNISSFIGVFYKTVKKYHGDIDNNITLKSIWKKFEWVREEQLMSGVTISTEDRVKTILEGKEGYRKGEAYGLGGVGAYSIRK